MPSPPRFENVAIDIDSDVIAVLKYNRPKAGNALNTPLIKDVNHALKWANAEKDIRIIITTGEGRFYTAGLDLLDPSNHGANGETVCSEFIDNLSSVHETLITTPKVVISAVNGPAPGWGTSSLALSDLVYSVPDSVFFTPFAQWGLCAEGCSSLMFSRVMGRQKASALILAGDRFSAADLESVGLITKILPKEGFLPAVLKIARGMTKLPPNSLRVNKELMMHDLRPALLETNRRECEQLRRQVEGEESKTAIREFAVAQEKRSKEKQKAKL